MYYVYLFEKNVFIDKLDKIYFYVFLILIITLFLIRLGCIFMIKPF